MAKIAYFWLFAFCTSLISLGFGEQTSAVEPPTAKQSSADAGPDAEYQAYSKKLVEDAKSRPVGVLLLGDSITASWKEHPELFASTFKDYSAANLGIGGDWTEMLMWRLKNGILGLKPPRVVILMIGSNDVAGAPVEVPAKGIEAIVGTLRKEWPDAKILLMGVLPRTERPGELHDKIKKLNERIAKLDDGGNQVKYLNFGDKLLLPNGVVNSELSHDFIHLTRKGSPL